MYAGAARVVVSLWSVNDKATAELMTKFYEKMLKRGERPASALRMAQVEMLKQKQWQSPYFSGRLYDARRLALKSYRRLLHCVDELKKTRRMCAIFFDVFEWREKAPRQKSLTRPLNSIVRHLGRILGSQRPQEDHKWLERKSWSCIRHRRISTSLSARTATDTFRSASAIFQRAGATKAVLNKSNWLANRCACLSPDRRNPFPLFGCASSVCRIERRARCARARSQDFKRRFPAG